MQDLDEAIVLHREARDLGPKGYPDRSSSQPSYAKSGIRSFYPSSIPSRRPFHLDPASGGVPLPSSLCCPCTLLVHFHFGKVNGHSPIYMSPHIHHHLPHSRYTMQLFQFYYNPRETLPWYWSGHSHRRERTLFRRHRAEQHRSARRRPDYIHAHRGRGALHF